MKNCVSSWLFARVGNQLTTQYHIPEEGRPQPHYGGNLKSRKAASHINVVKWSWHMANPTNIRHREIYCGHKQRPSDSRDNSSLIFALRLPLHSPLTSCLLFQPAKGILSSESYYVIKNIIIILRRTAGRLKGNAVKYAEERVVISRLPCT